MHFPDDLPPVHSLLTIAEWRPRERAKENARERFLFAACMKSGPILGASLEGDL